MDFMNALNIALRPALPADAPTLLALARDAIDELAAEDYDEAQRGAWIEALEDGFAERLAKSLALVATIGGAPIGFATLVDNAKIDLLYVDPRAARRGAADTLLDALERLAGARGASAVVADASDVAKPLFDKRGYAAQRRNTVPLGDEWLATTTMRKAFRTEANDNSPRGI